MKIIDLSAYLREHSYPGRGILLGRSADNKHAVIAYFIMGRSANSRNRVFTPVAEDDGIMTEAYDPSKMEDPSLIIYHPVRVCGENRRHHRDQRRPDRHRAGRHSRGQGLCPGPEHSAALSPMPPTIPPEFPALSHADGAFALSILKSADGDPDLQPPLFLRL